MQPDKRQSSIGSLTRRKQRHSPVIRFIARIIEFLGYDPFEEPKSLSEKLKTYRMRLGFSQKKMANIFGIDPGTLGNWERRRHKSTKMYRKPINEFLEGRRSIKNELRNGNEF
jgi:DNA-binding XRE family transcriptional regulator